MYASLFPQTHRVITTWWLAAIEGWVIFVTGIHPEAAEDDVMEAFEEFGDIRSIHMNLDRRTGFAKVCTCATMALTCLRAHMLHTGVCID